MQSRQAFILLTTTLLLTALLAGLSQVLPRQQPVLPTAQLENVRDYLSAITPGGPDYAIDGGRLFVGHPGYWAEIPLPEEVIAGAVDVRIAPAVEGALIHEVIYIGAANELAIYRTEDRGDNWLRGQLTHDLVHKGVVGGVTDLAVDPIQRLVYAGTDTAGLFRVRDGVETMKSSAQLLLEHPVLQVVTDRQGSGMTFVRTEWELYRGADFGLQWAMVDTLNSVPTAMALATSLPVALYVGTADQGVLRSEDGVTWTQLNIGLVPLASGSPEEPLYVDALAVDPIEPAALYVAVSRRVGTHYVRYAPDQLAYTRDGGATWSAFAQPKLLGRVTDLLPVSGNAAAVYLLTTTNRTPQALGDAPSGAVPVLVNQPQPAPTNSGGVTLAWIAAGLAALALAFALTTDVLTQPEVPLSGPTTLEPRPVRRDRWG
jgi:hypothetical protein